MTDITFADFFCGIGGMRLGFEDASPRYKCVYSNDYDKNACITYKNNFGDVICQDICTLNINDIPNFDVFIGGFPCFVAGTKVLTDKGYKNIEEVTLKDKLMTHTGKFQDIINLQRKNYNGNTYLIRAKHHSSVIECTPEHPFYVRKRNKLWNNSIRRYKDVYSNPEWIEAKNLTKDCYLGLPINSKSIIPSFCIEKKVNATRVKKIDIILDKKEQWYMMGYFIGDGWIEHTKKTGTDRLCHKIRFVIAHKDKEEVLPIIKQVLPITDKKADSGKCSKYGCADVVWFRIFEEFGKYAHHKKIPQWVQDAPVEMIREFINGYMKADGYKKGNISQITTVSYDLAYGLQLLYLKLGYIAGITKDKRPSTTIINNRTVKQRDTYKVRVVYDKKRAISSFIENGYAWFAPYLIQSQHQSNIPVYNFEVSVDNSYIVENITVHNCQPYSVAGKKLGFDDSRSNCFFQIINILKAKKPKAFLLENVKNLKTHNKGETYKFIKKQLCKIGYTFKTKILNTCEYSKVPQNRERIFMVGFLNRENTVKFKFPRRIKNILPITHFLESTIDDKYYYKEGRTIIYPKLHETVTQHITTNQVYQYRRHYVRENKSAVCPTLTANMGGGGHNVPIILDDNGIRKLTPKECINLQGFPRNYKLPNIADSHLYKQAGNSVSVPVIKRLATEIYNVLQD